jgi:quinoprotein glucose dehydrogenase
MRRWMILVPMLFMLATLVVAVPPIQDTGGKPPSPGAVEAASRASVAGGLKATLWAAEPLMANPVSFCFDGQGRVFVAETTRFKNGVPDTRDHMAWLEEDIASRSVADRLKMYENHKFGAKEGNYEKFDDQIRMIWDSTGKGAADKSTVYAGGFNQLKDGLGAGVLARKGSVYYTNIPDLYRLQDTKNEGVADKRESLATGFGLRVQFLGHDMHGLRMGPDGKLYFSIGDRGFNVKTKEGKHLFNPDSGAVLRCDLDGSNMEIVHTGLRNPQELAFDDFGNLFTYDNNCDSGDRARWVYIVQGGDSGWRCGYQYGDKGGVYHTPAVPQGNRGPWNTEKIWELKHDGQPAYIVPPLAHFGNGPSGITHYPGIGLNDKYKDHFFCCDFTSNPGGSKIWAVSVKPKGASFEVSKPEPFVQNMVPTDCEFGPDGAFYWSDWVGGWNPPNKGRIFRVEDPEAMKNPAVGEAKKLFAEGFEKKTVDELVKLLGHSHQQVRLEAQWELAGRKEVRKELEDKSIGYLLFKLAKESTNRFARIHAIWCLGQRAVVGTQISDNAGADFDRILEFADDKDSEIRAQVARVCGWFGHNDPTTQSITSKLLGDSDPRVQALALNVYGKITGEPEVLRKPVSEQNDYFPIFEILKKNNDADTYLRQAAVEALSNMTKNPVDLFNVWNLSKEKYDTPAVRLGVVLALRKLESKKLSEFLADADAKIVAEAARAIYDLNLMEPMVELAKLSDKPGLPDAVAFRAAGANFKLGKEENAVRVAAVAARTSENDSLRAGALRMLGQWAKPTRLDIITGLTQDLGERPADFAVKAIQPVLAKLFVGGDAVKKEAVATTTKLGIQDVAPLMLEIVKDYKQPAGSRVEALFALEALKAKNLNEAVKVFQTSSIPALRGAALFIISKIDPKAAGTALPALLKLETASPIEKQYAFAALGALPESKEADETLAAWLDEYAKGTGTVPQEIQLDLLDAAKARTEAKKLKLHAPLKAKLDAIEKTASGAEAKDHLAKYREALVGGDAVRGRDLFLNSSAVYCQRCHKLDNQGGEVGPVINGIAKDKNREYLLEAIVAPSKQIAKGYESVIINTIDGRVVSGVLRAKDAKNYTLVQPDGKVVVIPKDDIDAEKPDKSAMPDDLVKKLTKRELRDLVEFLSTMKEEAKK